jgi:hypothetical protein
MAVREAITDPGKLAAMVGQALELLDRQVGLVESIILVQSASSAAVAAVDRISRAVLLVV